MRTNAKNIIKLITIGFFLCSSTLWGRFYMGIEGGYMRSESIFEYTTKGNVVVGKDWKESIVENGGVANLILGTEHFFGETQRFGIRWGIYGGYGYTQGKHDELGKIFMQILSAGSVFDTITNLVSEEKIQVGFIGGLGYDFSSLMPSREIKLGFKAMPPILDRDLAITNKAYLNSLLLRFGLSALFNKHHRFEAIAQFPFNLTSISTRFGYAEGGRNIDIGYDFYYNRIQGLLSYKYVF